MTNTLRIFSEADALDAGHRGGHVTSDEATARYLQLADQLAADEAIDKGRG